MDKSARALIYRTLKQSTGIRDPGTVADVILDVLDREGYEVRPPRHLRPIG